MGHWLDELLGATRVKDDGEELPRRKSLNLVGFSVEDDEAGDQITIELGEVGGELEGDVEGALDENRVTTISGDEDNNRVDMECVRLVWDASASEGEPEIRVSAGELEGGALEVKHNGVRTILFSSAGVEVGGDESINQLLGGTRFSAVTVSTLNTTLDASSTATVVHVDASGERNVTMPQPAQGRTFLFLISGSSTVTIKRNASEQINGVSGNYVVPFADAAVIVSAESGNWQARSFHDESGGAEEAAIVWSPVDTLRENNTDAPADVSADGNQTSGTMFFVRTGTAVSITGIRFYWAGTANQVIKTVLYSQAGAVLATANVTTAGAGVYASTFASPFTAQAGIQYKAAVFDTSGTPHYTKVSNSSLTTGCVPARPFFGGRRIGWLNLGVWIAGDNNPTSNAANEWYLVEPVLAE